MFGNQYLFQEFLSRFPLFINLKNKRMGTEKKEFLTIKEVCEKYRASRKTVYRWRRDGLVSSIYIGQGKVLFNAKMLASELEQVQTKTQIA